MTENEKAATFIGWREGQIEAFSYTNMGCTFWENRVRPAPDMSDPRNYMKALEEVDALEVIFQQFDGLNVMIRKDSYSKEGGKETAYGFDEHAWGDAVISALAALYDTEHK